MSKNNLCASVWESVQPGRTFEEFKTRCKDATRVVDRGCIEGLANNQRALSVYLQTYPSLRYFAWKIPVRNDSSMEYELVKVCYQFKSSDRTTFTLFLKLEIAATEYFVSMDDLNTASLLKSMSPDRGENAKLLRWQSDVDKLTPTELLSTKESRSFATAHNNAKRSWWDGAKKMLKALLAKTQMEHIMSALYESHGLAPSPHEQKRLIAPAEVATLLGKYFYETKLTADAYFYGRVLPGHALTVYTASALNPFSSIGEMSCSLRQHIDVAALGHYVDNRRGFRIEKFNVDLGTNELLIVFILQDGGGTRTLVKQVVVRIERQSSDRPHFAPHLQQFHEHVDRNPAGLRVHDFDDVGECAYD